MTSKPSSESLGPPLSDSGTPSHRFHWARFLNRKKETPRASKPHTSRGAPQGHFVWGVSGEVGEGRPGRAPRPCRLCPPRQAFPGELGEGGRPPAPACRGPGEGAAWQAPSLDTITPNTTLNASGMRTCPAALTPLCRALRWSWNGQHSTGARVPKAVPWPPASAADASPQVATAKGLGPRLQGHGDRASRRLAFPTSAGVGPPSKDHRSQATRLRAPSLGQL